MPTVSIRPRARIDIGGIWEYIAEDSEAQADAFVDRLSAKFSLLAGRPDLTQVKLIDEHIDDPDRIIGADVII